MAKLTADVRRLLEGANYAHLATLLPDGAPHSVPVWIGVEGDQITVLTGPGSRKARNVKRDPRVSISVIDNDQPFASALIRGHVAEWLDGDPAWAIIDRMSEKYIGQPYQPRSDRIVLLIEPDHAQAITFG